MDAIAEDGSEHSVPCPNGRKHDTPDACWQGRIKVGLRYALNIERMTVGRVRVVVGSIGGFSNMGGHDDQTNEREEEVMCYETGIGSGSVYTVEPREYGDSIWCLFADEDEAQTWADEQIASKNTALGVELAATPSSDD